MLIGLPVQERISLKGLASECHIAARVSIGPFLFIYANIHIIIECPGKTSPGVHNKECSADLPTVKHHRGVSRMKNDSNTSTQPLYVRGEETTRESDTGLQIPASAQLHQSR